VVPLLLVNDSRMGDRNQVHREVVATIRSNLAFLLTGNDAGVAAAIDWRRFDKEIVTTATDQRSRIAIDKGRGGLDKTVSETCHPRHVGRLPIND
jgi:hypothetical protein